VYKDTEEILSDIIKNIEISDTNFNKAVERYNAIGTWIKEGLEKKGYDANIYPQGSFALNTVISPCPENNEYDVDLVCEVKLDKKDVEPLTVLNLIGDRLKENETYKGMLEKKAGISRCWTLKYADNAAGIGFHIDILPSIPENETTKISRGTPDAISIIDNKAGVYTWTPSNPKGFIDWFENKNTEFKNMLFNEATAIMNRAAHVDVEEIERKSKRSPLRQTIKLLKNHRDKAFKDNKTFAPKSILITTLATHLYRKERDLSSAVYNILEGLSKYSSLMKEGFISNNTNMIYREADGTWVVKNPALSTENFIEDWGKSSNSEYAKAFFNWVSSLKYDLERIMNQPNKTELINKSFNMKSAVFRDITERPLRTPSITTHQSQPWGY
jgi:hypothetical protein